MTAIGKMLILLGGVLLGLGILLTFYDRIPLIGKLPGDIHIKREDFQIYIPIGTSLVLSLLLTLIFWIVSHVGKK